MRFLDIIEKKKQGLVLDVDEIQYFVTGVTNDSIPDYQIAALLMAIWHKGLNSDETAALTLCMAESGGKLHKNHEGIMVDKHSTGGVSDTTTLVLVPILACMGYKVLKASGRGLGHTGGTIDKLESIPHFKTNLSEAERLKVVEACGCVVTAATSELAPADKKLYALRDVTATVDSLPLIASSVMSKKLAGGADILLLDVKFGSGAFAHTANEAVKLARLMTDIGEKNGRRVGCLISSMNEPLSPRVGCNLELMGALNVLGGERNNLYEVTKELAIRMCALASGINRQQAGADFDHMIHSGLGRQKLYEMIKLQGGDIRALEAGLNVSPLTQSVRATENGFVSHILCETVGTCCCVLGGGRLQKNDVIDHGAGLFFQLHVGQYVNAGDEIATLYSSDSTKLNLGTELIRKSYVLSDVKPEIEPLFYAYVDKSGEYFYDK